MQYIRKTSKEITNNFLQELLLDRGIISNSKDFQYNYFNPTERNEHDPLLMDNMEEGYQLLMKHLLSGNKIYICVDPDVDGFTSAAVLYNYLKEVLASSYDFTIDYHVPDGKEHGLQTLMPIFTNKKIADLIILPDSSSNDFEEHRILKDMGYDILVFDHHEASGYSEDAIVINNQLSKNYPNKSLSGVGVVYKFLEYFENKQFQKQGFFDTYSKKYLDLVALGQISDMMSQQTLENRYICDYGLKNINNAFFKELVDKQSFSLGDGPLTQIGVAFYITPLINALIRVGSELEKERLFEAFINPDKIVPSTKRGEKGKMETIVTQCVRNCTNAKARQNREKDKALEILDIQIMENCLDENKIIILNADELDVSNTLTGLIAMGVSAKYKKPVILGRISPDGYLKGSARGRNESELKDFKKFLQDSGFMTLAEGHANAFGVGLRKSNIEKLTEYANKELANINFNEGFYEADFIVKGNCSFIKEMITDLDRGRELYGQQCDEPLIVVEDITIEPSSCQIIGRNNDTIKFSFNGVTYIKFHAKDLINEILKYDNKISVTAAGKANMNYWGGRAVPQILLEEIEIKESSKYDF